MTAQNLTGQNLRGQNLTALKTAGTDRQPRRPRSTLDWAIVASVLLMLAMNCVAFFGDLGPATAYAAVPM